MEKYKKEWKNMKMKGKIWKVWKRMANYEKEWKSMKKKGKV